MNILSLPPLKQVESLKATGWIIFALEKMHGTSELAYKLKQLRKLERGTVGREVAEVLDKKGYRLIPKFESHDLKHLVLDYEMNMEDEIRMQAYLIGNGNRTFPCLLFLSLGIFYPAIWKELKKEYLNGKAMNSIHSLTLDDCKEMPLTEIKNKYGRKNTK